jgi:hypothetical protein
MIYGYLKQYLQLSPLEEIKTVRQLELLKIRPFLRSIGNGNIVL